MKRFDPQSIKERLLQRLTIDEDWSTIVNLGTIDNLVSSVSEGNAELARYLEYLYLERKWRTARNMSSLTHAADLIAYKRQRPISAMGYVIVSWIDTEGVDRLANFGSTFFSLDQASDFDDLIKKTNSTQIERDALVPWSANSPFVIPEGSIFKTSGGIQFISTETVQNRPMKEPWSSIQINNNKLQDFIEAGGWNGIKYVKVPVIQGQIQQISFGYAKEERFESYFIDSLDVENASNTISHKYFKLFVTPIINGEEQPVEQWEQIDNIRLAGPYDKVFETKIVNSQKRLLVKFGDGITGQMPPKGARLECEYLETLGDKGNVAEKYQITSIQMPEGFAMVDPRTNMQSKFLSCTNVVPISGGKPIQNEENFKLDAPPSYLRGYSIATKASYLYQVLNNSPINLLHCRIFESDTVEQSSFGTNANNPKYVSLIENSVLTEISASRKCILISAIRANGTAIDDPENELINPIIKAFGDRKSPNDTFDFIQPNFIEIRPNIIVYSTDTLTEEDVISYIKPQVLGKYSIFETDFEKPYYKHDIVKMVQDQSFTTYSEIFLEAKKTITKQPSIIASVSNRELLNPSGQHVLNNETLFDFDFQFDHCFGQDKISAGFKNFKYNAPYLVRVDLIFNDDPTKSRSLFLFDNRLDIGNSPTLKEAEELPINQLLKMPAKIQLQYPAYGKITFFDEMDENFQNRQCRTAQFELIDKITSDSYCSRMKLFNIEPYEIRPLFVDDLGKNKQFPIEEVPKEERLALNFTKIISGTHCYRINSQYYYNTKILFDENYDNPSSIDYAHGHLIIPIRYILDISQLQALYQQFEFAQDLVLMAEIIQKILENSITINVYAQPLAEKFECDEPFDIIYTSKDNLKINKIFIKS